MCPQRHSVRLFTHQAVRASGRSAGRRRQCVHSDIVSGCLLTRLPQHLGEAPVGGDDVEQVHPEGHGVEAALLVQLVQQNQETLTVLTLLAL